MASALATAFVSFGVEVGLLNDGGRHTGLLEAVPHYVDSQWGRVGHVGGEEAVISA